MPNTVFYILIASKTGEAYRLPLPEGGGIPSFLTRGQAAAKGAALMAADPNVFYLVEGPMTADKLDWQSRERARLADKSHTPLIPELAALCLPEHFAHVAKGDPNALAYTKNEADGIRDIQKRMNVTAYLKLYAPDLPDYEATVLQRRHQAQVSAAELKLAVTPAEIERVYTYYNNSSGVATSCMRHSVDQFSGTSHPVRAYGDSDLAVAYVSDDSGRTTARAVVWPAKRCYSRMYGSERTTPELQRLMIAAGYKPSKGYYGHVTNASEHSLTGARIKAVRDDEDEGVFCVPYLDEGVCGVMDDAEEWITIVNESPYGKTGAISIKETNGVATVMGPQCPSCRNSMRRGQEMTPAFRSWPSDPERMENHCPQCVTHATFICQGTGERFSSAYVGRVVVAGRFYARQWAEENLPMCDSCRNFSSSGLMPVRLTLNDPTQKMICHSCAGELTFWCEGLGGLTSNELRLRDLDVGARKRVSFGDRVKLIDRGHSMLSPHAALDPRFANICALAEKEARGEVAIYCAVDRTTGRPSTTSLGTCVRTFVTLAQALGFIRFSTSVEIILYTDEIEARLPRAGDWVRIVAAARFPEATGLEGVLHRGDTAAFPHRVMLPDGREAYCLAGEVEKLPAHEVVEMRERPHPEVGDHVMFCSPLSPRFGERGVVEAVETEDRTYPIFCVRFKDGTMRRGAAARLQPVPDNALPLAPVYRPDVYQVGDRVIFTPRCVEGHISSCEVGQCGTVSSVLDGRSTMVRADSGTIWATEPDWIEHAVGPALRHAL